MKQIKEKENIAMLIDVDNAPASKIEVILSELAKYGVVNIRKAYGNWKNPKSKGWEAVLHEYAIQPIQQFDYTKGKNASDMAMTIDAMELLFTKELDAFCIVSSDSDFTPLVMRILANGLKVYGFGEKKTPMPFVNACSRFLYLENLSSIEEEEVTEEENSSVPKRGRRDTRKSGAELKKDTKLLNALRHAIESTEDEEGWAYLADVGNHISNNTSYDPRNFGYRSWGELIRAIDLFEVQKRGEHRAALYVRDKRRSR
jgi:uncharacterized protein (TIGR00288 family)